MSNMFHEDSQACWQGCHEFTEQVLTGWIELQTGQLESTFPFGRPRSRKWRWQETVPPPLPTPSPDVGAINVSQPGDGASRAFSNSFRPRLEMEPRVCWVVIKKQQMIPVIKAAASSHACQINNTWYFHWRASIMKWEQKKNQQKTNSGESACQCILEVITSLNF